jgi:hypothetical protein
MSIERLKEKIQEKTTSLALLLQSAISSSTLSYQEICSVENQGLYIIFDDTSVLYVGKTTRSGKVRMRELASDFRSHTFNKKLLTKRLKDLGFVFNILKNETKKHWIESGKITDDVFKEHQKDTNMYIKSSIKFKFFEVVNALDLISLEHYAIAALSPLHND